MGGYFRSKYLASGSEAATATALILCPKKDTRRSLENSSNNESRVNDRELSNRVTGDDHERY